MNKYLVHLLSGGLCLLGISLIMLGLFFDGDKIEEVRGQQMSGSGYVVPSIAVINIPPSGVNSCEEVFFCKHPCTPTNTSGFDCVDYCLPGQNMGESCIGANSMTGVCVGICASTFQNTGLWTSCTIQPTDPLSCPVGDTCLGYSPQQTSTGGVCQGGCGSLHLTTGSSSLILTASTPGLCSGASLITGSLMQYSSLWVWNCSGPDQLSPWTGASSCSLHFTGTVPLPAPITFTLTGSLGTGGAFAQVNVCGISVGANANGLFSRSAILSGTNCSSISAIKGGYTCSITTQGPNSLTGNINNVAGVCVRNSGGGKPSSIGTGWHSGNTTATSGSAGTTVPISNHFAHRLRTSLTKFATSCAYTDIDYRKIMFHDIQWNPEQEAIKTLQAYCIVKGYTISHNTRYHTEAATSIGEAIKVLTKIVAMQEGISFDEFGWYDGHLPYSDMLPNAWYTPYVIYAEENGYLEGISSWKMFGRKELKALTPITKKQFAQLLENFGIDATDFRLLSRPGKYVMRDEMASVIVDAFSDELVDYNYLYGNNIVFYRWLLIRLEKTKNQKVYIKNLVVQMKKRDVDIMGRKYNFDVKGMIAFLEELLDE